MQMSMLSAALPQAPTTTGSTKGAPSQTNRKPLLGLPADCWVIVLANLHPRDLVRARRISKAWRALLTDQDISRQLLHLLFPRCREARFNMLHSRIGDLSSVPHNLRVEVDCTARAEEDWARTFLGVLRRYHHLESGTPRQYLKLAMPDMLDHTSPDDCMSHDRRSGDVCLDCRFKVAQSSHFFWMSIPVWPRTLEFRKHLRHFHFPDPMWWYSQKDALLVYPAGWPPDNRAFSSVARTELEIKTGSRNASFSQHFESPKGPGDGYVYRIFDPETEEHVVVPFDVRGKIIRRARLAQGVLIFEWTQVYTDNRDIDGDRISRDRAYKHWARTYRRPWYDYLVCNVHMVTVFDVVRSPVSIHDMNCYSQRKWTWEVRHRYKWKLPKWGAGCAAEGREDMSSTSTRDTRPRFFSAHTATHYALVVWDEAERRAHNRALYVWDMSAAVQPETFGLNGQPLAKSARKPRQSRPVLIRRSVGADLHYHRDIFPGPRLRPILRNIAIDEHNVYLIEEDHRWVVRGHSGNRTGTHCLVSCGIPVVPFHSTYQPHANPTSCQYSMVDNPVFGPQWIDQCPHDTASFTFREQERSDSDGDHGVFRSSDFCRNLFHRIKELPTRHPCVMAPYSSLPNALRPSHASLTYPWNGSDAASHPLQPRSFPGFPPCWRHDNFPLIGIAAVTDYAAGVRWVARDSRPLHKLTPLLTPTVGVNLSGRHRLDKDGASRSDDTEGSNGDNDGGKCTCFRPAVLGPARPPAVTEGLQTPNEHWNRGLTHPHQAAEVHRGNDVDSLADHLDESRPGNIRSDEVEIESPGFWENMMGRMTLGGDERWLIGQDSDNNITLAKF